MHRAAKVGMLLWSIICFWGACSGMMNVANQTRGAAMGNAEALGAGIGLFFWALIWFIPFVGMGIIALVTRPKTVSVSALQSTTPVTILCAHCGKYFAGRAKFCPLCGKPQGAGSEVVAASN